MPYDVQHLLKMSSDQLDELFAHSPAGDIPDGEAKGTVIIASGTELSTEIALLIKLFAWQGKHFDAKAGQLNNRVTPLGLSAVIAKVYRGPSWFDRNECIVLDYSETSLIAHWIRDEIRFIGSGCFLGRVYWDRMFLIHFSLEFEDPQR